MYALLECAWAGRSAWVTLEDEDSGYSVMQLAEFLFGLPLQCQKLWVHGRAWHGSHSLAQVREGLCIVIAVQAKGMDDPNVRKLWRHVLGDQEKTFTVKVTAVPELRRITIKGVHPSTPTEVFREELAKHFKMKGETTLMNGRHRITGGTMRECGITEGAHLHIAVLVRR